MKKNKPKKGPRHRGRPNKMDTLLPQFRDLGVFQITDAKRLGVSQSTLSRWALAGKVRSVGRGLYLHPESKISNDELDYIVAVNRLGPQSVIGGMTALFHYGLMEQVPQRIWVLVPYHVKTMDPLYRCIRTKTDPKQGVVDHGTYQITGLERTLVEAFRYSSKIGLRVALRATRTALAERRTTLQKIYREAKALGLEKFVEKYWEALVPEGQAS